MQTSTTNVTAKTAANSPKSFKSAAGPSSVPSSPSAQRKNARPAIAANNAAPAPTLRSRPSNQSNSSTSSQPKPRPRSALPVPKADAHVVRRKRRGSEDDGMEGTDHLDTLDEIASRPISPLPKRTRTTIKRLAPSGTGVKDASRASPPKNETPTPTKAHATSSTSLPRPRTNSTTTSSANTRVSQSSSARAPVQRVEKRPRLSSDAATAGNTRPSVTISPPIRRVTSGSVAMHSEDMSSDSISIADVSALLDVTPLRTTPAVSRKASLNRLPPSRGAVSNLNPSKRHASHGLPTQQNMAYLSPMSASVGNGRGSRVNSKSRTSILSWAEVSRNLEEDQLLAEVQAPFTRVVSRDSSIFDFPHDGSFSFGTTPTRERVDSGWGTESPPGLKLNVTIDRHGRKKKASIVPDSRLSIGQVLFPSVEEQEENALAAPMSPESPVESTAVKLLQLQVHSQEERAQHYLTRISMLEEQLRMSQVSGALGEGQNAMLEQRVSSLEVDLLNNQQALSEKDNSFDVLARRIRELEELRSADEAEFHRKLEDAREEMEVVQEDVERRVQEEVEEAVEKALAAERRRFQLEAARREARSQTRAAWKDAQRSARDELEAVRAARESLAVLLSGLAVHK